MEEEICVLPYKPTDVQVGAYSGKILKITFATELEEEKEEEKLEK